MKVLIVNYHYLENRRRGLAPYFEIREKEFEAQLKQLKKHYVPISFATYAEMAGSKTPPQGNYVIVSFDDGLKECATKAAPIAGSLEFPLTFFVCGMPVAGKEALAVQKIHLLVSAQPIEELAKMLQEELLKIKAPFKRFDPRKFGIKDIYSRDVEAVRNFKLDVNYCLPYDIRDRVVDKIFKMRFPGERALAEKLYLNSADLKKLVRLGFEIGGHGYSHLIYSRLGEKEQEAEIRKCRSVLDEVNRGPLPFSTPFGLPGTHNSTTIRLLKKHGFFCLATMGERINDENTNFYDLARFDVKTVFDGADLRPQFRLK